MPDSSIPRSVFVALNGAAGRMPAAAVRDALSRRLAPGGPSIEIRETAPGERIDETVRAAAARGFDRLVAAGGDGTISAAMSGAARTGVPLALLPTGTTNLVARELGIPLDLDEAAALALGGASTRSIDGMAIGGRLYVLQVGVGLSALVVDGTTRELKRRFGALAYVGTAIRRFFELRPRSLEIEVDGAARRVHSLEAAVLNDGILARLFFPRGPEVRMDDGRVDVCVLVTRNVFDYARLAVNFLAGRPVTPHVLFLEARGSIEIRSDAPLPVQADGDLVGVTPLRIDVLPRAVAIVVPAGAERAADGNIARAILIDPYLAELKKRRR